MSSQSFMVYIVHLSLPLGSRMAVDMGDWPLHTFPFSSIKTSPFNGGSEDEMSLYSFHLTNSCKNTLTDPSHEHKNHIKCEVEQLQPSSFLFSPKTNDLWAHSSEDVTHQSCCFRQLTWGSNVRTTIIYALFQHCMYIWWSNWNRSP